MDKPRLNPENQQYNDGALLLDGLFEFHPDFFDQLSTDELSALRVYYLTGAKNMPDDVFEYRAGILSHNPQLKHKAQAAYKKLRQIAGMQD